MKLIPKFINFHKKVPFVSLASDTTAETKSKANRRQPFILKTGSKLIEDRNVDNSYISLLR